MGIRSDADICYVTERLLGGMKNSKEQNKKGKEKIEINSSNIYTNKSSQSSSEGERPDKSSEQHSRGDSENSEIEKLMGDSHSIIRCRRGKQPRLTIW